MITNNNILNGKENSNILNILKEDEVSKTNNNSNVNNNPSYDKAKNVERNASNNNILNNTDINIFIIWIVLNSSNR